MTAPGGFHAVSVDLTPLLKLITHGSFEQWECHELIPMHVLKDRHFDIAIHHQVVEMQLNARRKHEAQIPAIRGVCVRTRVMIAIGADAREVSLCPHPDRN